MILPDTVHRREWETFFWSVRHHTSGSTWSVRGHAGETQRKPDMWCWKSGSSFWSRTRELFSDCGPFCMNGGCEEGKMTCGKSIPPQMLPTDIIRVDFPKLCEESVLEEGVSDEDTADWFWREKSQEGSYLHSLTPQSLSYAVVISVRCQDWIIALVPVKKFRCSISAFKCSLGAHEHRKKEKAAMSFYDHCCKKCTFPGGIEPSTSA